jgi:hypothetical protein
MPVSDRQIEDLRAEWSQVTDKLERIYQRCDREGRQPRPDEMAQSERLTSRSRELQQAVELAEAEQKLVLNARNLTLPPDGSSPSPGRGAGVALGPVHNSTGGGGSVRISSEPLTYRAQLPGRVVFPGPVRRRARRLHRPGASAAPPP